MTARLTALALLGCLLALTGGVAQDRQPGDKQPKAPSGQPTERPQPRRTVYPLRHADPAAIAQILAKHFQGQADVSAVGSGLLISAPPAVMDEIAKLLEQIDHKPRTVQVEVMLADVTVKKGPDGKDVEVDLSGDVSAKLEALVKSGQASVQRVKLTAIEGQPIASTTGGNRPYASGTTIVGGGGGFGGGKGGGPGGGGGPMMQRSINYQPVGTTVRLTTQIGADNAVSVDLNLQDSKVRPPEAGDEVSAVSMDNGTLTTRLSIPAGKTVTAQSVRTDGKTGTTLSLVLVTAKPDPEAPTRTR
jgi:hypothetical protein